MIAAAIPAIDQAGSGYTTRRFAVSRWRALLRGPVVLPVDSIIDRASVPAWLLMCLLAGAIFAVIKLLTWLPEARRMPVRSALIYLFGWPGLDPMPFLASQPRSTRPFAREWWWAATKAACGVALVGPVRRLVDEWPVLAGAVGMAGLVISLHFGSFHLLALTWRRVGYDVRPIMNAPLCATSLLDFWSRRWNLAFRDMAHRLVLRPLLRRVGPGAAMAFVFLVSGVLHDLVISIPARAGYGLPTLYFLIQACGVPIQRSAAARKWGLDGSVRGWVATAAFVIGPVGLLFPAPFLTGVVVPFLDVLPV
jgi:hypothetical protein